MSEPPTLPLLPKVQAWTKEKDDLLLRLRREGLSAALIAQQLNIAFECNVTRNSVIGRLSRLGLSGASVPKIATTHRLVSKRPDRRSLNRVNKPSTDGKAKPKPNFEPIPVIARSDIPHPIGRKTFAQLEKHDCKWPVDQPDGSFKFCAQDRVPGLSYCEDCCRRAYDRPPPQLTAHIVFKARAFEKV